MHARQHRQDLQVSYLSDVSQWNDTEASKVRLKEAGLQKQRDRRARRAKQDRLEESRQKAQINRERVNAATIRRQAQKEIEKLEREERVSKWMGKTGMQSQSLHGCGSDIYIKSTRKRLKKVVVHKDCTGTYEAVRKNNRRRSRDSRDRHQDHSLVSSVSETQESFPFSPIRSGGLTSSRSWHSDIGGFQEQRIPTQMSQQSHSSKMSGHSTESFFMKNLYQKNKKTALQTQSEPQFELYGPRRYPNKTKSSSLTLTRQ